MNELHAEIKRLFELGFNYNQIGKIVNIHRSHVGHVVVKILKLNSINYTKRKIDRSKVKELLMKGFDDIRIAKELNCSRSTIRKIRLEEFKIKIEGRYHHLFSDKNKLISYLLGFYNMGRSFDLPFLTNLTNLTIKNMIIKDSELYELGNKHRFEFRRKNKYD